MADDGGHMDGLQTMGIINALKTGNVQLDLSKLQPYILFRKLH